MTTIAAKRPNAGERRTAMLEAAAAVFFEQGYAATSIDSIIEMLGGSKRNIYNEFGNKEGLFTALVSETADKALAVLTVENIGGHDLKETLLEFGRRLLTIYMSPTLIGVYRTIMTEAMRFPSLAKVFYEKGPGRASARLGEVIEEAKARKEVDIDDCRMAADHFVGMLRDNLHLQIVLGLRLPPDPAEAEAVVVSAVTIFLHGIGRKTGETSEFSVAGTTAKAPCTTGERCPKDLR